MTTTIVLQRNKFELQLYQYREQMLEKFTGVDADDVERREVARSIEESAKESGGLAHEGRNDSVVV